MCVICTDIKWSKVCMLSNAKHNYAGYSLTVGYYSICVYIFLSVYFFSIQSFCPSNYWVYDKYQLVSISAGSQLFRGIFICSWSLRMYKRGQLPWSLLWWCPRETRSVSTARMRRPFAVFLFFLRFPYVQCWVVAMSLLWWCPRETRSVSRTYM